MRIESWRANLIQLVLVAAFVSLLILPEGAAAQQPVLPTPSATVPGDWQRLPEAATAAIVTDSGAVALLFPREKVLRLYPALLDGRLDNPVEIRFDTPPVALVRKRVGGEERLAVLEPTARAVHVLDGEGKRLGTIELAAPETTRIVGFAAANDDPDPVVYYGRGGLFGKVNLATMRDEGVYETLRHQGDFQIFAARADGQHIYATNIDSMPGGLRSFVIDDDRRRLVPATSKHAAAAGTFLPDDNGFFVAAGPDLFDAQLTRRVALLPDYAVGHVPGRPFVLTLNLTEAGVPPALRVWSTNTLKQVAAAALPERPDPVAIPPSRDDIRPTRDGRPQRVAHRNVQRIPLPGTELTVLRYPCFASDAEGRRGIIVIDDIALAIDLAALSLPDEPVLAARISLPVRAVVGEAVNIQVEPVDPERVRVELTGAPAGVKLEGDRIVWTPGPQDLGEQVITLRLSSPDLEATTEQSRSLIVERSSIALPFDPDRMHLAPDGRHAVIVRSGEPHATRRETEGQRRNWVAVVDLVERKLLWEQTLQNAVYGAATDGTYVVATYHDVDGVDVMRTDDPKPQRLLTKSNATTVSLPGDGNLYIARSVSDSGGPYTCDIFALKDLRPVPAASGVLHFSPFDVIPRQSADGTWHHLGVRWAQGMSKPLNLIQPAYSLGYPVHRQVGGEAGYSSSMQMQPAVMPWDTYIRNGTLIRCNGTKIGQMNHQSAQYGGMVLAALPVAVSVATADPQETAMQPVADAHRIDRLPWLRHELLLFELNRAASAGRIPLRSALRDGESERQSPIIAETPTGICVIVATELFVIPNEEIAAIAAGTLGASPHPPLHVKWNEAQPTFVASQGIPLTLPAPVAGGEGKRRFTLATPVEGAEIDADDGTLRLDAGKAIASKAQEIGQQLAQQYTQSHGSRGAEASSRPAPLSSDAPNFEKELAASVLELPSVLESRAFYERLTGRKPEGVVVAVPADVNIADSRGQAATLWRVVLVDVAPEEMIGPLAASIRQQDERQLARQRQQMARQQLPTSRPAAEGDLESRLRALEQRVSELERENERLRGQNEVLRELLGEREAGAGAPATRPAQ